MHLYLKNRGALTNTQIRHEKPYFALDFMLEEELIDLVTFCLQNPDSNDIATKKHRISEIGKELYADGGIDALENFFFAIENRVKEEIGKDPKPFRSLWNGLDKDWKY